MQTTEPERGVERRKSSERSPHPRPPQFRPLEVRLCLDGHMGQYGRPPPSCITQGDEVTDDVVGRDNRTNDEASASAFHQDRHAKVSRLAVGISSELGGWQRPSPVVRRDDITMEACRLLPDRGLVSGATSGAMCCSTLPWQSRRKRRWTT